MDNMNTNELVSALADGQLQGEAFARGLARCAHDAAAIDAWRTYHLIGDVLRSSELAAGARSEDFMAKLSVRLASEAPLAIQTIAAPADPVRAVAAFDAKPAANESVFRWKVAAGVASLAAVAAVGWTVVSSMGATPAQPQLAATEPASGVVLAGSERGPILRDARLDELMAAHRQLGGANALQAPAGFLRNATFEGPQR